jgi:signal transduction histidine kinase
MTRFARAGIAGRLFTAQTLVVLVGGLTLGLVASVIGPTIFHNHLGQVPGGVEPQTAQHVEEAYASASAISLAVAMVAALATALAVSAYLARRVARPAGDLAAAATEVADGHYGTRVAAPGLGREFDTVAQAFNAMAARLADVESMRRRLLADLGHELRTPVATIEAYVDAAEDGVAVAGEDTWAVLRAQARRLKRLADDIAAVSRAEEHQIDVHIQPLDAGQLANAALDAAHAAAQAKGIELHLHVGDGPHSVLADPERMGQVLGNVLDNALRHTPSGGTVTLALEAVPNGVRFTISDNGEGILAEHLPHIFERFYRADPTRDGGSGIGLAVARAIVDIHNGHITAASKGPGTGAIFTILLLPAGPRGAGEP